jgi:hypothetical protein
MATKEQKKLYTDRIKPYKTTTDEIKKQASLAKSKAQKNKKLEPFFRFRQVILSLQLANTLEQMSALSITIQDFKNESILNDARKELGNVMTELMKVVGDNLDGSLTENKDLLEKIEIITARQRLNLLIGIRDTLETVKEALGTTSKWRWYFPDLHLKLAIVAKNLLNFKEFDRIRRDPQHPDYEVMHDHLRFIVTAGHNAAQQFRTKYELSTKELSDLQTIQRIFEMIKRIYTLLGNQSEVQKINTSLEAITQKVEIIMAEKENKKK